LLARLGFFAGFPNFGTRVEQFVPLAFEDVAEPAVDLAGGWRWLQD
jgi:hypothetical protein